MLKEEYDSLRMKGKMEAFNNTIMGHAQSERPYSANLREQLDSVMYIFDKHFPKEQEK